MSGCIFWNRWPFGGVLHLFVVSQCKFESAPKSFKRRLPTESTHLGWRFRPPQTASSQAHVTFPLHLDHDLFSNGVKSKSFCNSFTVVNLSSQKHRFLLLTQFMLNVHSSNILSQGLSLPPFYSFYCWRIVGTYSHNRHNFYFFAWFLNSHPFTPEHGSASMGATPLAPLGSKAPSDRSRGCGLFAVSVCISPP